MRRRGGQRAGPGKKKAGSRNCLPKREGRRSNVGLGLAQTGDALASFPLAAFLEQLDALVAFKDVAFRAGHAGAAQAGVL